MNRKHFATLTALVLTLSTNLSAIPVQVSQSAPLPPDRGAPRDRKGAGAYAIQHPPFLKNSELTQISL
jgi:hypothetical protein